MERLALDFVFHFSAADLLDNQRGKLSEAQSAYIRREALQTGGAFSGALTVVFVLGVLSSNSTAREATLVMLIGLLLVGAILYWFVGKTELAIQARVVKAVTGELSSGFQTMGARIADRLLIADQLLPVTRDQLRALHPGAYTVYYVPGIQKIVSIESYSAEPTDRPVMPTLITEPIDDTSGDVLRA